jgi:hypothetical protein
MSVEDLESIDFVSTDRTAGDVELTISDHLDWTIPEEHIRLLQAKIYRYLDFVDSGEILDRYPLARGKRLVIRIIGRHLPPPLGWEFLEHVRPVVEESGGVLKYEAPEAGEPS